MLIQRRAIMIAYPEIIHRHKVSPPAATDNVPERVEVAYPTALYYLYRDTLTTDRPVCMLRPHYRMRLTHDACKPRPTSNSQTHGRKNSHQPGSKTNRLKKCFSRAKLQYCRPPCLPDQAIVIGLKFFFYRLPSIRQVRENFIQDRRIKYKKIIYLLSNWIL